MPEPKKNAIFHAEALRRSSDSIHVHNPTNVDYVVEWDKSSPIGGQKFRVSAKSKNVPLIRYIAEKYIREMANKTMIDEAEATVEKENERRVEKGLAKLTVKEETEIQKPLLRVGTPRYKKIISTLYGGVAREHGMDREDPVDPEKPSDPTKSSFEQALVEVEKERIEKSFKE